jgi:hypothetical protein
MDWIFHNNAIRLLRVHARGRSHLNVLANAVHAPVYRLSPMIIVKCIQISVLDHVLLLPPLLNVEKKLPE